MIKHDPILPENRLKMYNWQHKNWPHFDCVRSADGIERLTKENYDSLGYQHLYILYKEYM